MDIKVIIDTVAQYLRGHITEISVSVTAVIIMLAGPYLTSTVKRLTKTYNWFFRYCCFILLCTVGVGFLTKVLYQALRYWFGRQGDIALILWVAGVYLGLALFAKMQREI